MLCQNIPSNIKGEPDHGSSLLLFATVVALIFFVDPMLTFLSLVNRDTLEIRNVWAENVEEEMALIREVIEKYPYVAMDTEFPGVVAKPVTEVYTSDYHYKSLKVNVDLLKIIQLGLSFADEKGNFCPGCPCWQFNFKFDLDGDMFAQDSIDLLIKSGILMEELKMIMALVNCAFFIEK